MKVELLAPAGSYESMVAAYSAGADAVYLGGAKFGARAFADNLDTEQMKKAIDYAHIRDKKLYLTVNTLLKQRETEELYEYLLPFYREGLDAVIVQDFGVFKMIRETFPDMDLHASTQMTVTGVRGAAWLQERGASRVVTARELSLEEIRKIHEQVPVEIESFVHGALCFCYSGQCLLSSMIGGRSGNRGRCAQPCRLPYQLYEDDSLLSRDPYLMSPKDMCTLDLIPELVESGIYSFKMEGRMKKPEYTAGITSVYRKYIDQYLNDGKEHFRVQPEDKSLLMDLYNRGGFSQGYYHQHNGKDMMSMQRPNHWGTEAAKMISAGRETKWKALEDLNSRDVLELRSGNEKREYTLSQNVTKGAVFSMKVGNTREKNGTLLYRTRNEKLISEIRRAYLDTPDKIEIDGELLLQKGCAAQLQIRYRDIVVSVSGTEVQNAQKRPLTEEDVRKQISKLGQTEFRWGNLHICMDEEIFLPVQELNELRRKAIEELMETIFHKERKCKERTTQTKKDSGTQEQTEVLFITAQAERREQIEEILACDKIKRIYLSSLLYPSEEAFLEETLEDLERCREAGKESWYVMPWIFREEKRNYFLHVEKCRQILEQFDGILVKNLEEIQYLQQMSYCGKIALDHNMYIWNREAVSFWQKEQIDWMTLPVELTDQEIRPLSSARREMIVYGYAPLMVTAQCFQKNTTGCQKKRKTLYLKDRKGKYFPIRNDCSFCYNILYNSAVTELADQSKTIVQIAPASVRLSFTIEDARRTREVLNRYTEVFADHKKVESPLSDFTRGHLKRGVE